jgi:hypothetical protein
MVAKQRIRSSRREPILGVLSVTFFLGCLALLQNQYGQFSDIRGFYGMHFSDGQNHWPFSYHTLIGSESETHPVEYPALTGLVMWLISFLVPVAPNSVIHYYWITAILNTSLFSYSAYLVARLCNNKLTYAYVMAPAVLYSLHRNWDIWALVPMLLSIIFFERKKYVTSSAWLAIAIATKFFPIVLLLPIWVYFARLKQQRTLMEFTLFTGFFWTLINIPFILVNFEGWAYFYRFSYERGYGGGSLFEMLSKLGTEINISTNIFYVLNFTLFSSIVWFLLKIKEPLSISQGAFITLFAFTLFNKQYSMQYVIWLAPFAILNISMLKRNSQKKFLKLYVIWQGFELFFQYAFFQNILTNTGKSRGIDLANVEISELQYGLASFARYSVFVLFFILLLRKIYEEKNGASTNKDGARLRHKGKSA